MQTNRTSLQPKSSATSRWGPISRSASGPCALFTRGRSARCSRRFGGHPRSSPELRVVVAHPAGMPQQRALGAAVPHPRVFQVDVPPRTSVASARPLTRLVCVSMLWRWRPSSACSPLRRESRTSLQPKSSARRPARAGSRGTKLTGGPCDHRSARGIFPAMEALRPLHHDSRK